MAQEQIRTFRVLSLDYYPRESHLVTFKDPYSFPVLYHPECNNLVAKHMDDIAERVSSPHIICLAGLMCRLDHRSLCRLGRVPDHSLLQTQKPHA